METRLSNGLLIGHAYSITRVLEVMTTTCRRRFVGFPSLHSCYKNFPTHRHI